MLTRSPTASSTPSSGSARLTTGNDSPVSAASSAIRLTDSTTRASAGTLSPGWSSTTSPGTTWLAGTCVVTPPRTTLAVGAAITRNASIARSARYSWMNPRRTANTTMTAITTDSTPWPRAKESAVAANRMMIRMFLN